MSTEPRKFMELGSDLLVKTTSFQKAANSSYNTRKRKVMNSAEIALSFCLTSFSVFLSNNRQCSTRPSHIVNTTKTKDKKNIGKTYVSSLWVFSPLSIIYTRSVQFLQKYTRRQNQKSCPWNHTRSNSFSV